MQDGDPYPEWPEDAEAPEGESEVSFRLAAAETIKGRGNELFKQERHRDAIAKYNKVRASAHTVGSIVCHIPPQAAAIAMVPGMDLPDWWCTSVKACMCSL